MRTLILLLLWESFVSFGFPRKQEDPIIDIFEIKSIPEINEGHDDTRRPLNNPQRSAVVDKERLWKLPVSYIFAENLDLNTKGVVLRALDQFRLKSCVDFKPLDDEEDYIKVIYGQGCGSVIGKGFNGEQELSLGENCDAIFIAEHEFLHALGFQHEHVRYDRDDYVVVNFTNVREGWERNFQKVRKEQFTPQGTQYDYWSVMHYGQYFGSNGNGPTIIPKDTDYDDVIGRTFEMSTTDALELNLLYECKSSIAFLLFCDFSNETACPVTTCSNSSMTWEKVSRVPGGPTSDHTSLPSGDPEDLSHFMHVSTAEGQWGDSARLQTMRVTPNRACIIKCLQLHYHRNGSESDVLNIWIREFESERDLKGNRRLIEKIHGPQTSQWKVKHVPLYTSKSFQVEFEVQKGGLPSSGGISIDDINLSELQCPHATLQIDHLEDILLNTERGYTIYSPTHYSSSGYAYSLGVRMDNPFIGVFVQLVSGKYDDEVAWPVPQHQVTLQMVDQTPDVRSHMSIERSATTDLSQLDGNGTYRWGKPEDHGMSYIDEFNQTVFYGPKIGLSRFSSLDEMQRRSYLKGGTAVFNIFFEDVQVLSYTDDFPCPPEWPQEYDTSDTGSCSPKATAIPPRTTDDKRVTRSNQTTKDRSIFGNAPKKISSPSLIFLLPLALFMIKTGN